MRPSVRSAFPAFTERFEGRCPWMYLDTHAPPLVTTAVGNLIDPVSLALELPWMSGDVVASTQLVLNEWQRVKSATDWAQRGGGAFAPLTSIRLSESAIDALVLSRLDENEAILVGRVSGWKELPANAQLATHSMAWAMGPWFKFPKFEAALEAQDWGTCSLECHMDDKGNRGLVARNLANAMLFSDVGEDPEQIYGWPVT